MDFRKGIQSLFSFTVYLRAGSRQDREVVTGICA